MAIDDSLMRAKGRAASSFLDRIDNPNPLPEAPAGQEMQNLAKKADPLPVPGDDYRPHARFLNRLQEPQVSLHFVAKDCTYRGFPYSHLERVELVASDQRGGGLVLLLRFSGTVTTDVRIEGRNLRETYSLISSHVMPWVWERPDGIYQEVDAAMVISKFAFTEVER